MVIVITLLAILLPFAIGFIYTTSQNPPTTAGGTNSDSKECETLKSEFLARHSEACIASQEREAAGRRLEAIGKQMRENLIAIAIATAAGIASLALFNLYLANIFFSIAAVLTALALGISGASIAAAADFGTKDRNQLDCQRRMNEARLNLLRNCPNSMDFIVNVPRC